MLKVRKPLDNLNSKQKGDLLDHLEQRIARLKAQKGAHRDLVLIAELAVSEAVYSELALLFKEHFSHKIKIASEKVPEDEIKRISNEKAGCQFSELIHELIEGLNRSSKHATATA